MTRKKRLTLIACILMLTIALCALGLGAYLLGDWTSQKEYRDLASDAIQRITPGISSLPADTFTPAPTVFSTASPLPEDTPAPSVSPSPVPTFTPAPTATPYMPEEAGGHLEVNFEKLLKTNPDTIAWLYLPDTSLSYPVVAANAERDEGYYLTHSHQGRSSSAGTLFIESWASPDFSDKNTLIHGHRMNSGAMFGSLYKYARQNYYEAHPSMELYTPEGNWHIRIFASYEAELGDFYAQTEFESTKEFENYIARCLEASEIDTSLVPGKDDRIVTLVTCVTGQDTARRVVQGILEKMD